MVDWKYPNDRKKVNVCFTFEQKKHHGLLSLGIQDLNLKAETTFYNNTNIKYIKNPSHIFWFVCGSFRYFYSLCILRLDCFDVSQNSFSELCDFMTNAIAHQWRSSRFMLQTGSKVTIFFITNRIPLIKKATK